MPTAVRSLGPARGRFTPAGWLLACAVFGSVAAHAGDGAAALRQGDNASASRGAAAESRPWLLRIHAAAHERNYQGTLVFSADGVMSSSRVAHFCEGNQSWERVEALDGRLHQTFRHNSLVHTLWPRSRVAVVEQRESLASPPVLLQTLEPRVEEHYELREQGADRVAGRTAQVLLLRPRDEFRFAQRIWADKETGLMLRADVLGRNDEVLESSAFSSIDIGIKPAPESVLQPMKRLEGYRIVRPAFKATQLDAEGWAFNLSVPGFKLASCVKRTLDPTEPADGGTPQPQVMQAVFSDGLTRVSLFVEPLDGQHYRKAALSQTGATHTLMQRHGDWWVTVMGDVPPNTLKQFVKALERKR